MKLAIALITLGILGIGQYIYFQFTSLAFNYEYTLVPYSETLPDIKMVEVTATRDWTVGIIGAIIGAIMIFFGIWRFRRQRQ